MPLTVLQCRQIIRQATQPLGLWTAAAEDLLLGTAIQESRLIYTCQMHGPALGYWQMEPATHDDIWKNFLAFRPIYKAALLQLAGGTMPLASQMATDPVYAAALARFKYKRNPLPLPCHGDIAAYAHQWKQIYNTSAGAGTEAEFINNWHEFEASGT